jgi:hypothetical protein
MAHKNFSLENRLLVISPCKNNEMLHLSWTKIHFYSSGAHYLDVERLNRIGPHIVCRKALAILLSVIR